MLRFIVVALVACVARSANADVSHLPSHYLPPMNGMRGNADIMVGHAGNGGGNGGNGHNFGNNMQSVTTSIEKQELRELPTQTEYLPPGQQPYGIGSANDGNNNGNIGGNNGGHSMDNNMDNDGGDSDNSQSMEIRPLSMLMPQELLPTPTEPQQQQQQQLPADMRTPATHYLPPQDKQQQQQPTTQPAMPTPMEYMQPPVAAQQSASVVMPMPTAPSRQYLTPSAMPSASVMPAVMPTPSSMPLPMPMPMPMSMPTPVRHYLSPHVSQPTTTYQQYQEQLPTPAQPAAAPMLLPMPAEFVQQHRQLMQYIFPTIDTPIEVMPQSETEAAPAHFLTTDGYHYRNGNANGNANSVASRRFRIRL